MPAAASSRSPAATGRTARRGRCDADASRRHSPGDFLPLETHRHIARRACPRVSSTCVEIRAHPRSHFLRRSCVICRCCSAASRSSVRSSFCSRRRKICRISAPLLPVAHTIKMRPNRRSYSRFASASAVLTASSAAAASSLLLRRPLRRAMRRGLPAPAIHRSAGDCETLPSSPPRSDPRQISSDAASSATLRPAAACAPPSPRAHAREPQQGRISFSASLRGKRIPALQHRRSCSRVAPRQAFREILPPDSRTTAARYLAVDRISSIGRISAAAVFLAKRHERSHRAAFAVQEFVPFRPSEAAPARRFRAQSAHRGSTPSSTRPSAAMQTFEIACALRVPTFRAYAKHIRRIAVAGTSPGSVHPPPASSSCSQCETSRYGTRRSPRTETRISSAS